KLTNHIRDQHSSQDEYALLVMGRKGRDFFRKRKMPIIDEVTGLPDSPDFADIKNIAAKAVNNFASEQYDELYLVYNQLNNAISQTPVIKRLLPLDEMQSGDDAVQTANYEYEPSAEEVLATLLPKYAETLI